MGRWSSLALVGNPSRDGVSIKILVGGNLKTQQMSEISNQNIEDNDVNGAGALSESPSSGRIGVVSNYQGQAPTGRHQTTDPKLKVSSKPTELPSKSPFLEDQYWVDLPFDNIDVPDVCQVEDPDFGFKNAIKVVPET